MEYLDNFHIHISNVYGNLFEFHLKISNFGRNFERENSIVDVLWSIWNGINWLPHRTPPQPLPPLLLQRLQFNDNWRTKSIHKLKVRDGRGGPRCPTLPPLCTPMIYFIIVYNRFHAHTLIALLKVSGLLYYDEHSPVRKPNVVMTM